MTNLPDAKLGAFSVSGFKVIAADVSNPKIISFDIAFDGVGVAVPATAVIAYPDEIDTVSSIAFNG